MSKDYDDDDDELFGAMIALVRRYGVQKCRNALNAVSIDHAIAEEDVDQSFFDINEFVAIFFEDDTYTGPSPFSLDDNKKVCLYFDMTSEEKHIEMILKLLEHYNDSIRNLLSFDPRHEHQRKRFQLGTLTLSGHAYVAVEKILARPDVMSLFQTVVVKGNDLVGDPIPVGSMIHVKELVVYRGGFISSLSVTGESYLYCEDASQFPDMLKINQLESLEVKATIECSFDRNGLTKSLTESLSDHVWKFADASKLQVLDLGRLVNCTNTEIQQELLEVIGMLPNLHSFGITLEKVSSLESLIGSISQWKIRHFNVCFDLRDRDLDFRPLFDAVAASQFIGEFSLRYTPTFWTIKYHRDGVYQLSPFPMEVQQQAFDFALAPTRGALREFTWSGVCESSSVPRLVSEAVNTGIQSKCQLRRFDFMRFGEWNDRRIEEANTSLILPTLQALLDLVSTRLPYLYDVGLFYWVHLYRLQNGSCPVPEAMTLYSVLMTQLDDNQVGMALFEPDVLPTIPAGLWSMILKKAITCRNVQFEVPWTSIFKMVRRLVEVGSIGGDEASARGQWGVPSQSKRRKVVHPANHAHRGH